jgi:sugar lactone lactonase YvrE
MLPLADIRTLKPNGMALGPDGNLYVTDLTEMNIRKVTGPNGDTRLQTVSIIAVTGDGRGANGTIGFIGNKLYISENRAASWVDITSNCALGLTGIPCTTVPIPLPSGAFVAGVATDPVNRFVYASDSPGGAGATIWRYSEVTGQTSLYLQGGTAPAAGTPNATVWIAQTATRPWDPAWTPGGLGPFSFVFGLAVGPDGSLYVTEDHTAGNRGGRGTAWVTPLIP